ncbi:MAG: hypothetical protein HYY55_01545 [Candidatus Niyogibacteria bacterium]|nr:MAG: hypothetical protein HYY55_01545 [Candidatus Niyogibacteria bacterium]
MVTLPDGVTFIFERNSKLKYVKTTEYTSDRLLIFSRLIKKTTGEILNSIADKFNDDISEELINRHLDELDPPLPNPEDVEIRGPVTDIEIRAQFTRSQERLIEPSE